MNEGARACLCHKQGQFTLPGAREHYAPDLGLEPVHIVLDLRLDIAGRTLEAGATTRVRATAAGGRRLALDAVDLLDLAVGNEDLSWRYDGQRIELVWGAPFEAGETREVALRYRVERPVSGLFFSAPDEQYPQRRLFAVTDHETERARHWLPCVDHPAVRTTFEAQITAAADLVILAGGLLEWERDNGDGTKTARWVLDYPCPSYLYCFAAGQFVRAGEETVGGVEIAYFSAEGTRPADLVRSFGRTAEMMRWLQQRLDAPFPFRKYYQIALPDVCGAMENISLVTWDQKFVLDLRLAAEYGHHVDQINIHEMAHAYFGDALVIRDFASAWLKESWATYIEGCWLEARYGADALSYELHVSAEEYFEEVREKYARPIATRRYNHSWDLFDRHLYPGGAWRLHMLRRELGEELFWGAVADYVAGFSRRVVETGDFVRALEARSGRSLGPFFDQWIFRAGHPRLKVSFEFDGKRGEARLDLEQTQVDEARGIGLFRFELVLAVEGPEPGAWRRFRLPVEGKSHVHVLPVVRPLQLCFDPDDALLFELECNPGDDLLRRALVAGPTVRSRIAAARELAKGGKRAGCRAIAEAYRAEPFWGVRREMARELGRAAVAEAVEPLAAMLLGEQDPRVLGVVAEACGKLRDERLAAALEQFLDRPGLPYMAQAAALASLGAQRDARHLPRLAKAAEDTGWRAIVRSGALRGLGQTRLPAAFDLLRGRTAYGVEPEPARTAAVWALAESAAWQEPPRREAAVAELVDRTRDPHPLVRLEAAAGLARLRAAEGQGAIEAMKPGFAAQDAPRLERHLAAIRKGREPAEESVKLRETVEELREKLRALDRRLQAIEHPKED